MQIHLMYLKTFGQLLVIRQLSCPDELIDNADTPGYWKWSAKRRRTE